ncbi:MAG TPA: hypothetical protein VGS79_13055 [Puia sp.]|nr:hypothetical protein [Puia sp.]
MGLLTGRNNDDPDPLSRNMQDEVIKIASERLGYPLPANLVAKVRQPNWSYMGLEMMIDSVREIEKSEILTYLSKLV